MSESPHLGFNGPQGQLSGIVGTEGRTGLPDFETSSMGLMLPVDCVETLLAAASGTDQDALAKVVDLMLANGVPTDMIVDHCFPAVARALGAAWCDDRLAFSTVTVGCSRLEAKLHDLDPSHTEEGDLKSCVLLLLPHRETHTLGPRILALQLRRRQTSVRVLVGEPVDFVSRTLRESGFDGVFLSAAHGNDMKALRDLTLLIRTTSRVAPPVILGGAILKDKRFDRQDLLRLTGADFACDDPDEALRLCGIVAMPRAIKQRARGN